MQFLSWRRPAPDAWLARFGPVPPACARELLTCVRAGMSDPARLGALREAAEALGVLRAHQGNAVDGLVEDLLGLRAVAEALRAEPGEAELVVDAALRMAVSSYVAELTVVLESKGTRDPLTGLPNRAAFEEVLGHEVASHARTSAPALLLVDLDRFKSVNDTHGHLAGDDVLVAVAQVLRSAVRPTDVACRLGGDEFAIVLPRTGSARAVQVGRRLLAAARTAPDLVIGDISVGMSLGVGWLPAPQDVPSLVALADRALYSVKAAGGDDVAAATLPGPR